MSTSPHKSQKGHCGLCQPYKRRGIGRALREPWAVVRRLGKKRRLSRRDLDADQ